MSSTNFRYRFTFERSVLVDGLSDPYASKTLITVLGDREFTAYLEAEDISRKPTEPNREFKFVLKSVEPNT